MIRTTISALALFASVSLATPATAQSTTQDEINSRYDRALAAGYKALFLCSAIANAEHNGATRDPESVERWELTGIQSPLAAIISELPYTINRPAGRASDEDRPENITSVSVEWAKGLQPRIAEYNPGRGCNLLPVGRSPAPFRITGVVARLDPGAAARRFRSRDQRAIADAAFLPQYGANTRTTAVLVQKNGVVLGEAYADDFGPAIPQRTWSVAKSIAATLVGASLQRGEMQIDRTAGMRSTYFSDYPLHSITIDQLLRMASGRYSDTPGNRTDPLYFGGSTVEETATHWPIVNEPGTVFRYANNDTLMAVRAISEGFKDHSPAGFFTRIGMQHTVAETDWQGSYILSSQVWSTARDLAKLGQLYLDDGVLPDGTRILPEGWTEYVATPSGPQPDGPFGYGAGFWLFNKSDGIPPDTYAAMGNRGQYVVIVPSRNVVIVRRGEDPAGYRFDIAAFTRDVLATLD